MNDFVTSLIRTVAPLVAARLVAYGFEIDEPTLILLLSAGWYGAARALERVHPRFGWLIGYPSEPAYR